MLLIRVTTAGTPAFSDDERSLIGYDRIESFYNVVAHEDDLDQYDDGEVYAKVEVLGEISHDDILSLFSKSCQMQGATREDLAANHIPA